MNLEAKDLLDVTVSPRYQGMQTQIEHLVMDAVREQLNRRQGRYLNDFYYIGWGRGYLIREVA